MDYKSFTRTNSAIRATGNIISALLSGVSCFKPDSLSCTDCDLPMTVTSLFSNLRELKAIKSDGYDYDAFHEAKKDEVVKAFDTLSLCALCMNVAFKIARIAVVLAGKKDEDED